MKYSNEKELECEAGKRLDDRWESWKEYCEPYWEQYDKINKEYHTEQDESPNPRRRSRLKFPTLFTTLETLKPITYEALVGEKPYIGTAPRHEEDDIPARAIQGHQTYMLDQASFPLQYYYTEHQRLLFGTAFAFCPWMLQYGLRKREVKVDTIRKDQFGGVIIDPNTMQPIIDTEVKKVEKDFKIQDNIDYQPIDPWMICYDPAITNAKDLMYKGEGVIRQWYTSKEEIRANKRTKRPDGSYKGIYPADNVKECLQEFSVKKDTADSEAGRGFDDDFGHTDKDKQYKDKLLMREGWMKLPVRKSKVKRKKNGEEYEAEELIWDDSAEPRECVVTKCASTGTVMRVIVNPTDEQFRPFLGVTCYPVPGRLPGISFGRILIGLIKEVEKLKNNRLDYLNFIMNRPWVVNVHSGIQVRDTFNIPNRIIKARDINGIKPLDMPDYAGSVYRDVGSIDFEIQNASGVLNANQDASKFGAGFGETATGINHFQNMMGSRMKVMVRIAEFQLFVPLGTMMFNYGKQFVTREEFFRVMNSENPYQKVEPEAYGKQIDFIPVGAHDRITKGQQVALLDRLLSVIPQLKDLIKVEEVIKDYLKLTNIAPDPQRYMMSPEEQMKRAKMAQVPDVKPKLSLSMKGEDMPPEAVLQILQKEYGIKMQVPNLVNPQGIPGLPGQLVNQGGIPGGGQYGGQQF